MRAFWQFWGSYFSKEQCDEIVNKALTIPSIQASTYGAVSDLRSSRVRWIHRGDLSWNWMFTHIENIFRRANGAFGFDLNYFHEIQFTEYDSAYGGHYGWHEDLLWVPRNDSAIQRKLSIVIQLSDPTEYTGGDLQFDMAEEKPDANHLKFQGSAIVFPSFIKHRVTPVETGRRYSLVTWYEGPPFR